MKHIIALNAKQNTRVSVEVQVWKKIGNIAQGLNCVGPFLALFSVLLELNTEQIYIFLVTPSAQDTLF